MASFPSDPKDYPYWRIVFYDVSREPKQKTIYLKKSSHYRAEGYTKTEAFNWKKRKELEFKDGTYDPWQETDHRKDPGITLQQAIDQYLAHAGRELADTTVEVRAQILKQMSKELNPTRPLTKTKGINNWINAPGIMYKTKMKRQTAVRALYDYHDAAIETNVYARKKERLRATSKAKTWIQPDEFGAVIEAAKEEIQIRLSNNHVGSNKFDYLHDFFDEFENVFLFLVNTALRRSDLLNLNTDWFIEDCRMMRIGGSYTPKSQREEIIPLTPQAQQIARHWLDKYGRGARPFKDIRKRYLTRFMKDVFRRALPQKADRLSLHKTRDTAAMYLLFEKGYSPQTVRQITRHEDLSTLNDYLHWAPHEGLKEIENKG